MNTIKEILESGNKDEKLALFSFSGIDDDATIIAFKFNIWVRYFYPQYFFSDDANFHGDIDLNEANLYKGEIKAFVNIIFRGGGKTTRKKLFIAFVILNDKDRLRRFFRLITDSKINGTEIVTDIYNIIVNPRVKTFYPNIFKEKVINNPSKTKTDETRGSFTTLTGIRMIIKTVGVSQRGDSKEENRPDYDWYDDFETRKTLHSAVKTKSIWDNMEEARTGLAKHGVSGYTCNFLSESGNVYKLVEKHNRPEGKGKVLIVPIWDKNKIPAWDIYTKDEITDILRDAEDPEGEYLCSPSTSSDIFFDRKMIDSQIAYEPISESTGFKKFYEFDSSHRYAGGHDISGGVGLDSSTSVFIDFTQYPARVVATYNCNTINPIHFGDEMARQGKEFGKCLLAPENNFGTSAIHQLSLVYPTEKIYKMRPSLTKVSSSVTPTEYGFKTGGANKGTILFDLKKAIEDGHLELTDQDLINELKVYTRNNLMEGNVDARLVTRHFDLLMACAIAWHMRNEEQSSDNTPYVIEEVEKYDEMFGEIGI